MALDRKYPVPLLCVGNAFFPLEGDGKLAVRRGARKILCVERDPDLDQNYASVPLDFGLEMLSSLPKSYLWLSSMEKSLSVTRGRRGGRKCRRLEPAGPSMSPDPLDNVPVYSIKELDVSQVSEEDASRPVEYEVCFTSKRHLKKAWRAGRGYLLAATLTGRMQSRQRFLNMVHSRMAQIAVSGMGNPSEGGDDGLNEDEDGLVEPIEVKQLAAELGMHNMQDKLDMHGNSQPPAIAQFGATMLCGFISTVGPIIQAAGGVLDGLFSTLPVLDRIVLGDGVPPQRAPIMEHRLSNLLMSCDLQNERAGEQQPLNASLTSSERPTGQDSGSDMRKKLSSSALWMGISIQLLLNQYLAQQMISDKASMILDSKQKHVQQPRLGRKEPINSPLALDIFSDMMTSLHVSDFVRGAGGSTQGSGALDIESVLMAHNGIEIGYKRWKKGGKEANETPNAKGVILIGSLDTVESSRRKRSSHRQDPSACPVAVVDARRLMKEKPSTS